MNATIEKQENGAVAALPELAVPTAEQAIMLVNRWLQKETAMLIHVTQATFNPITFCWHLPVRLSYPDRGTIGIIGDIFIHAASGEFVGLPDPQDILRRAESLAEAHGLIEEDDDEEEE
jgi:hypothetical protein